MTAGDRTVKGGGGASTTTEQAAGTSTATDVSLKEFVATQIHSLERHVMSELEAMRREFRTASATAEKAVEVASTAAKEQLEAHNGLIRQMQAKDVTYATRESLDLFREAYNKQFNELKLVWEARQTRIERFQSMVTGALTLIGAIGVANLVKVWLS